MKTLHLIRHAKSSWDFPNLSDHQRPLNKRGEKDSLLMSTELLRAGFKWPEIFCSSAQRAQLTIRNLMKPWFNHRADQLIQSNQATNWQTDDRLYTFSCADIWAYVNQIDEALDAAVLVGHNPAFTDFINSASNANLNNLPTCAYAQLVFSAKHWSEVRFGSAVLQKFLKPKMFK